MTASHWRGGPLHDVRRQGDRPIVILGAGLAGLSLANALLDAGVTQPIVLLDRRRTWARDRTWCTWLTGPLRFGALASHRWWAWRIRSDDRDVVVRTARHPYIHLDSSAVYEAALDRLAGAAHVEVRTGQTVLGVGSSGDRPQVRTAGESFEADEVFDAMGAGSPLLRARPAGDVELAQRFLGWEVEVDAPTFDVSVVTLMDFRPHDGDGVCFMYVLPFSPTRALVEHTSIGTHNLAAAKRRLALEAELGERWHARQWRVLREERGLIPMTTFPFPAHHGPRVHAIGAAAGAIRPSSGYAFTRIQRHVTRVAAAVAAGQSLPQCVAPARFALLDRIFLKAFAAHRQGNEDLFVRLAQSVPADAIARFMTDVSSPRDEASILASQPKLQMTRAAVMTAASPAALTEALRAWARAGVSAPFPRR